MAFDTSNFTPEQWEQFNAALAEQWAADPSSYPGATPAQETVELFDVSTGQMVTKPKDPNLDWSINGDQWKYGTMPDGSTVRIDTTVENWRDYGGMQSHEEGAGEWTYGYQAPPAAPTTPSWDDGLQGNLGNPTDPPAILQPTPPVDGGGGDDGGGAPVGGGGNGPTDDWFWTDPVGYENAPQPDGDGSFREVTDENPVPSDTSWDWNYFRDKAPGDRQWGGYDEDYQAFERYQPGMDSPWGMPNIEGGNEDFYQQQFVNQLRDEQGFRNRQRSSEMRAQEAADNPYEGPSTDEMWSWANGGKGLPEVQMGGEAQTPSWDLIQGLNRGDTLGDSIRFFAGKEGFSGYEKNMRSWLDSGDESLDGDYWTTRDNPNDIITRLGSNEAGLTGKNRDWLTKMANSMYQEGAAGPYSPAGYASPIAWGGDYNAPATQTGV